MRLGRETLNTLDLALAQQLDLSLAKSAWLEKLTAAWADAAYNLNAQTSQGSPMDRALENARGLDAAYHAWLKEQES